MYLQMGRSVAPTKLEGEVGGFGTNGIWGLTNKLAIWYRWNQPIFLQENQESYYIVDYMYLVTGKKPLYQKFCDMVFLGRLLVFPLDQYIIQNEAHEGIVAP